MVAGGFPTDAHPMAVLSSAVSALSTFYQDSLDPFDREHVEMSTVRLMAKLPTIASYAYKKSVGQPLLYPDNSMGYVENFLRMTFGVPAAPYDVDPTVARVLDMLFVLHADHEQNCSTSTVRLVGSSNANLFASVWLDADKRYELFGSVSNLFDKDPPACFSCSLNNYDPTTYDIPGRFGYARLSYGF